MGSRSKTWKQSERDSASLFGGVRVPLSGSNSRHRTQGDVMPGDPDRDPPWLTVFPSAWLYVEAKRLKGVQKVWRQWEERRAARDRGGLFRLRVLDGSTWFLFLNATAWRDRDESYEPHWMDVGMVTVHRRSAIRTLWLDSDRKAHAEGRRTAVVAQRVHGRPGIYLYLRESDWALVHPVLKTVRAYEQREGGIEKWRDERRKTSQD